MMEWGGGGGVLKRALNGENTGKHVNKYVLMFSYKNTTSKHCSHVFSPFNAHLYPSATLQWEVCKLRYILCRSSAQVAFYQRVFPLVHQWCTSHHFVVRLYAQQVVLQMWDDGAADLFPVLKDCVDFVRQNG